MVHPNTLRARAARRQRLLDELELAKEQTRRRDVLARVAADYGRPPGVWLPKHLYRSEPDHKGIVQRFSYHDAERTLECAQTALAAAIDAMGILERMRLARSDPEGYAVVFPESL